MNRRVQLCRFRNNRSGMNTRRKLRLGKKSDNTLAKATRALATRISTLLAEGDVASDNYSGGGALFGMRKILRILSKC